MTQAKGVLPTGEDREVLYRNPRTNGYFIGVQLHPFGSLDELKSWLTQVDGAIDALVEKELVEGKPARLASVAVGFGPSFFAMAEQLGSPVDRRPVGLLDADQPAAGWFPGCTQATHHVLFYVASVTEARVSAFLRTIAISGYAASVVLERGYQRPDETEPFGYKDGVRNVRSSRRYEVVYVHTDGDEPDEPAWTDGGTYMVAMKIVQNVEAFNALPDQQARDGVIGRRPDGSRLDLAEGLDPHDESADVPAGLPANSHVRKAAPRGAHDDVEIFRRGLPFFEVVDGRIREGLMFCSFQANPSQFDAIFSDWMLSQHFPQQSAGHDALMTPAFTEPPTSAGLYFVPPHNDEGLAATLFSVAEKRRPRTGRLAIQKRVGNPAGPAERFERGGFTFYVTGEDGAKVEGSDFTTKSTGRGVCPVPLNLDNNYTLVEAAAPAGLPVQQLVTVPFTMDRPNKHLLVPNTGTQSGSYGTR